MQNQPSYFLIFYFDDRYYRLFFKTYFNLLLIFRKLQLSLTEYFLKFGRVWT